MGIFSLLILFQIKHFLCDYPLQRPWMLGKFKEKGWFAPLACHALTHAVFTQLILMVCGKLQDFAYLILVDFIFHFIIDRVKASPNLLGKFNYLSKEEFRVLKTYRETSFIQRKFSDNTAAWFFLGFDQMLHHLTHYFIIWKILEK